MLKIGLGKLKLLQKNDFYFLEIRFLLFHANKLSPLNKKFHGKKYTKFVISRVFFIRFTSNFYQKITLIFKLSILHTISHDNYYGIE